MIGWSEAGRGGSTHLLIAAFALLLVAWVVGNPPGMSPDEPAHYRKAVALAYGDVRGRPGGHARLPAVTDSERSWLNRTSRALTVPSRLRGCDAFRVPLGGRCPRDPTTRLDRPLPPGREVSYVATYPPFASLVPAAGVRAAVALGGGTVAALVTGRALVAALCLALVALAGRVLLRPERRVVPVLGLALAVSPMVPFLMAELSPSGPEVAGALCFTAAALRLTRAPAVPGEAPAAPPSVAAVALAAGGLVLVTSRSVGPLWLVALVVLVVALRGPKTVAALVSRHPGASLALAAPVVAGALATLAWALAVEPRPPLSPAGVLSGIPPAVRHLPDVAAQAVGVFGWVDVSLPGPVQLLWLSLVAAFAGLALLVGSRRDRNALALAVLVQVLAGVAVSAAVIRPTSPDFRMQGRYLLPLLVAFPLLAAEILAPGQDRAAGRTRWAGRTVLLGALVVACAIHGVAWAANARHYATNAVFLGQYPAGWRPPGGWLPWALLVTVAVALGWLAAFRLVRGEDGGGWRRR